MNWIITVRILSPVPLSCDIEILQDLGINLTGETIKPLSDKERAKMFALDFSVKCNKVTIEI